MRRSAEAAAERAKQSRARREITVDELINELGLPQDSKYMGHVIHCPEHDHYLASLDEQRDNTFRAYAKSPEGALVLSDYADACRIADGITKKTLIGILFDVENQLYVAFNED